MGTNLCRMLVLRMAEHESQLGRNHHGLAGLWLPRRMEKRKIKKKKKKLFTKVICARLRSPPTTPVRPPLSTDPGVSNHLFVMQVTTGTNEEDRDDADYELKRTVVPDEADVVVSADVMEDL